MQAYRLAAPGGLEDLRAGEEEEPQAQRGELLLRVRAVSLNYRDAAIMLGRYPWPVRFGLIPASDAAAEVVAVGDEVTTFAPGDRVLSNFHPRWFSGPPPHGAATDTYGNGRDGWLTELKAVSQEAVVPLPDAYSYEEGSTLPCAAATAWKALSAPSPIRTGHTVLTLGSGGVSLFALQLAKALGARVVATTSSAAKEARLRELGAGATINYSDVPHWGAKVRELTDGHGADRVIEVGGPATINESLQAVAFEGEIASIGFLGEDNPGIDFFALKRSGASIRPINVGDRRTLEDLVRSLTTSPIKPVIDRVFEFADARAAFDHLINGRHFGKIVVRVA